MGSSFRFPFSESAGAKRRPELSRRSFNEGGHVVLAMITIKSEPSWLGDTGLKIAKRPVLINAAS